MQDVRGASDLKLRVNGPKSGALGTKHPFTTNSPACATISCKRSPTPTAGCRCSIPAFLHDVSRSKTSHHIAICESEPEHDAPKAGR